MAKKANPTKAGTKFTKKVTRGVNKGDTVKFKVAKGGKPFPQKVVKDVPPKNKSKVAAKGKKK